MIAPHWKKLINHASLMRDVEMRQLFDEDPNRFKKFSIQSNPLLVDFSKNRVIEQTLSLLFKLAEAAEVEKWRDKMFAGEIVNNTEQRSVLHTALRSPVDTHVSNEVDNELARMERLCNKLHHNQWLSYKDTPIKEVVVIGIGGSYLGPKLACEALSHFTQQNIKVHYVANVDAHLLDEVLKQVAPEDTLFVVISKSFSTQETTANAETAAAWLREKSGIRRSVRKQFVAITSNAEAAKSFGIDSDHILNMWDWVGGRYSLWSTVGFPLALQIGMQNFRSLLTGAYAMDKHFQTAPLDQNLPIIMGLLGIWYINFLHMPHHAVLPYDHRLRSLPAYLQQLDMESNGKSVTRDGKRTNYNTGPIIFGEAGTNGQHAFHQLLHQGIPIVPCDFIGFSKAEHEHRSHHDILLANMLAQSQAMMMGRSKKETIELLASQNITGKMVKDLSPHMTFPGNRPSNTIMCESLTPTTLGALLSLYEHKVFVQGIIWNINSFDQMGVELGKTLTNKILPVLQSDKELASGDCSTKALIDYIRKTS
ncbi:MAG: glucose-6-phosphate isomerase [Gammaproteobacteria bacterium]|nr:glucose-6-phosphate isomerase [Gammaproteobacteria bacterium]